MEGEDPHSPDPLNLFPLHERAGSDGSNYPTVPYPSAGPGDTSYATPRAASSAAWTSSAAARSAAAMPWSRARASVIRWPR